MMSKKQQRRLEVHATDRRATMTGLIHVNGSQGRRRTVPTTMVETVQRLPRGRCADNGEVGDSPPSGKHRPFFNRLKNASDVSCRIKD
jgi:hypothetical protein